MKVVRDESVDRQALQDAVCDAVYGQETAVKITIDVEKLDGRELHFFERIGEGTYGNVEFEVFSTVPQRSLEIWVEDERYLISSEDLIKATLQAVLEDQRGVTMVLNERDEIVDIEGYGKEDQIQAAEALRDELQRYIEGLAWDAADDAFEEKYPG